jgi:prepilin-type N-terminal cleavage/methylation domain-containing protein
MIHNPQKSSHSGFTLVELLVAMAISAVLLGAIYGAFVSAQKLNTGNEVTARIMQNLRTSLDLMESDIRMAGLTGLIEISGVGIEEATATKLRFTADRNMDGEIYKDPMNLLDGLQEHDLERITYFYDAPTKELRQCLSEGTAEEDWDIVADQVENFSFSYFDEDNNVTADMTLIRTVEVSMTIEQTAGRSGNISRTMTRRIFCRNLAMK